MWSFLFDVAKVYLFSEPHKHFQFFFQKKCIFCVFLPKLRLNIANLAFQDSALRGFETQKLYPNAFAEKGESNNIPAAPSQETATPHNKLWHYG